MSELKRFGVEGQISTYGLRLRARQVLQHEKGFGQPSYSPPPDEAVEEQFQEKLLGGFKLYQGKGAQRRKVMCQTCFQVYTATGTCGCY